MTENEAIKCLDKQIQIHPCGNVALAFEMAIQALEEIQQYKELGTVEDIQLIFSLCKDLEKMVKKYEAIGTVDEFKALKEKSVAKNPRFYAHNYYCTECGNLVGNNEYEWQRFLYCDKCGQKIDWQGDEKIWLI